MYENMYQIVIFQSRMMLFQPCENSMRKTGLLFLNRIIIFTKLDLELVFSLISSSSIQHPSTFWECLNDLTSYVITLPHPVAILDDLFDIHEGSSFEMNRVLYSVIL